MVKIASIHWGFIPGGGAVYARCLEEVGRFAPVRIKSFCLNAPGWPLHTGALQGMDLELVEIRGRLDLSWVWKTREFLKRERPHILLTHGVNGALVAAVAGAGLGIPLVSSWHGEYFPSTFTQKMRQPFFDLGVRILFRTVVKEIVTVSDFSRQILIQKGISPCKITVIHNGIPEVAPDERRRLEVRRELSIPEDAVLVGTACRLSTEKGLQYLLQACALVLQARRNVRLVIWGDGSLRQSLLSLAEELGIADYVRFPGYRPDIPHCLSALDIYALSSLTENFSIALLEAMRAGLAIVATDVGGNPEAIEDGVQGFLVPYANPQAMAARILALAEDPEMGKRLGYQARQRFLEEFTSDRMVAKTAAWLMECFMKHWRNPWQQEGTK
jgi:glycosyltransferase involved in cell wall biosynthesis